MFVTDNSEDDVVKLRGSLSDIKFIAQETLHNHDDIPEKVKSIIDDIIKIADIGMYKPKESGMQRAKNAFNKKYGCCNEEDQ